MNNTNLNQQPTQEIKKKWIIPVIIGVVLLLVGAGVAALVYYNSVTKPEKELQKQLDLGDKYLTDMDYDNAILAYKTAIEIDSNCVDAYWGIADAYYKANDFENAEKWAEKGYSLFDDSRFLGILDTIKNSKSREEIEFGEYNGSKLQWIVLDKTDGKMVLISKYVLDPSFETYTDKDYATWEDSNLRKWLNGSFYEETFSAEEKSRILKSDVTTGEVVSDNVEFLIDNYKTTQDYVYCLSIEEYTRYFKVDNYGYNGLYAYSLEGICPPLNGEGHVITEETYNEFLKDVYGRECIGKEGTSYYLRETSPSGTPGLTDKATWCIDSSGAVHPFFMEKYGVRPVIEIKE